MRSSPSPRSDPTGRPFALVLLLLSSLLAPVALPTVAAHDDPVGTVWPMEGSNDTGWIRLDATSPGNGLPATAAWNLSFAPGATLDNVSFQLRVSGADGLSIDSPMFISGGSIGNALIDLSDKGWLGTTANFDGGDPFTGRTSTNGLSTGWTLPEGAEVTDLIIEALAPVDPITALGPAPLVVTSSATHPDDGRLWLADATGTIWVLDDASNPSVIDMLTSPVGPALDLVVDEARGEVLVRGDEGMAALDLNDGTIAVLPDAQGTINGAPVLALTTEGNGDVLAVGDGCLYRRSAIDASWSKLSGCDANSFPISSDPTVLAMEVLGTHAYVSVAGDGVIRYDLSSSTSSVWSSANVLHSDRVTAVVQMGPQVLFGSEDAGIARYNPSLNLWQATWSSANWLAADDVNGLILLDTSLWVLAGDTLQRYDTTSGVFTSHSGPSSLSSEGMAGASPLLLAWRSGGARAPADDTLLLGDGTGTFLQMRPSANTVMGPDLVIISAPPFEEAMTAVAAHGDEVYVGGTDLIAVYDTSVKRWTRSMAITGTPTSMAVDAADVWIGTDGDGVVHIDVASGVVTTTSEANDPDWNSVLDIAYDGGDVVMTHSDGSVSAWSMTDRASGIGPWKSTSVDAVAEATGPVAIHNRVAYVASGAGLLRLDLDGGPSWLSAWGSTGVDFSNYAPVAEFEGVLHYGLWGYGVVRIDLATGEILQPITSGPGNGVSGALPSDFIYGMGVTYVSGNAELAIGTQNGAIRWDGSTGTNLDVGNQWDERPQQHLEFLDVGSTLYAATNLGVCRWVQASNGGVDIDGCLTVYDGMPNWATYALGRNATHLFGGTLSGVGIIDLASFSVEGTWETLSADNAPVAVVGDVAYIGLDGLGVARWDLTNGAWLSIWDQAGVLDTDGITGLAAGSQSGTLWVGGDDGFQLIDVVNGTELVDIEKTNTVYLGSGDPYDLTMLGDVLWYHQATASDQVYRIDTSDLNTAQTALDAGTRLNQNNLGIAGLGLMGDVLLISAVSNQWWNAEGSGGLLRYDTVNGTWLSDVLPGGAVDNVKTLETSNGDLWVQWGEGRLDRYASNGTLLDRWEGSDVPNLASGNNGFPNGGGMVEWNGEVLFATDDGLEAYDPSTGNWSSHWSSSSVPEVYEVWTDGTWLAYGVADGGGWNFDAEVIVEDTSGTKTTVLSSANGDFSNAYPISMTWCGGLLWTAFFQLSGGASVIGIDPTGSQSSVELDGQDLQTNARPSAVTCAGTDLHIGFYQNNAGITVWDTAGNQRAARITTADGLSNDPVMYDAMTTIGTTANPIVVAGHVAQGGSGGYTVYDPTNPVPSLRASGSDVVDVMADASGNLIVAIPGGGSGYSHVDQWSPATGTTVLADDIQLTSGAISSMVGSGSSLYAATYETTGGFNGGSSSAAVLVGSIAPNGSLAWTGGHLLPGNGRVSDMVLDANVLHVATSRSTAGGTGFGGSGGIGLQTLANGSWSKASGGLSDDLDGLAWHGNNLVVGLRGGAQGVSGVQVFNPLAVGFVDGGVLGGLPSETINAISRSSTSDIVYVGTPSGVGRWDASIGGWDTPISTNDGLQDNNIEDVMSWTSANGASFVLIAGTGGLALWNESSATVDVTWDTTNGLLEDSTWAVVRNASGTVMVAHDGAGLGRPGVSLLDASSGSLGIVDTMRFDQLPSNDVTAVAADWWGVHVATDTGALTHWNSLSEEFEEGVGRQSTLGWPVDQMESDGSTLMLRTSFGLTFVEASASSHAARRTENVQTVTDMAIDGSGSLWASSTVPTLYGWGPAPGHRPVPSKPFSRATPLNLGVGTGFINATAMLHPGFSIDLLDAVGASSISIPQTGGAPLADGFLPLVFSSPVQGAPVWAISQRALWNGTFDMADEGFVERLQAAIDTSRSVDGSTVVELTLLSPTNGSLEVRLSYDWSRTETPVDLMQLIDRPDDGGGALRAGWSLVHDEDFARYLVFAKAGGWATPPTAVDLATLQPDAAVALHSRLESDVLTAEGQPLMDGTEYEAIVVVEYADGRLGRPSLPVGPVAPSDEVPRPPATGSAQPSNLAGAKEGDLDVEWTPCTAMDHASTRVYASTVERTDVLGLTPKVDLPPTEGNSTVLSLVPGKVYWIGLTCVDDAGQENKSDVLILGPVVPTGGLNDGVAPPPVVNLSAVDAPDDEGGRLSVSWNQPQDVVTDCAFLTVWLHELGVVTDDSTIDAAIDDLSAGLLLMEKSKVITDCVQTSTVVNDIGGRALVDGRTYLVSVTSHDAWLNVDLDIGGRVEVVDVIPYRNLVDSEVPPDRLSGLIAFDHPADDGSSIDIEFPTSVADDFSHYIIWAFTEDLNDVSAYVNDGTPVVEGGFIRLNTQLIDTDGRAIVLPMSEALQPSATGGVTVVPIQAGMTVYAMVTVHDLDGNAHLDNLDVASALAVDNLADIEAPPRITELSATDRPNDDGRAVLLEFLPSTASDIDAYHIYVSIRSFDSIGGSALGSQPIVVNRDVRLPVVIDRRSDGAALTPGQEVVIAVVAVDSAGNAHVAGLTTTRATPIDNGVSDPGAYLDAIVGTTVVWVGEVDILVAWEHTTDASVNAYRIYYAASPFSEVGDATFAGEVKASNSFRILSSEHPDVVNTSGWYVAVTPVDDAFERLSVEPVYLEPLSRGADNPGDGGGADLRTFLESPNALIAGLVAVAVLLALLVLRRGGGRSEDKAYGLQEATWGLDDAPVMDAFGPIPTLAPVQTIGGPSPPAMTAQPAAPSVDLYASAQRMAAPRVEPPAPSASAAPSVNDMLDGLDLGGPTRQAPPQSSGVDTSFLDDLF